jgi:UDP-N-acetylmuramoylalanine--D-glutamate ligase
MTSGIADRVERARITVRRISARNPVADGVYAEGEQLFAAANGASRAAVRLSGIVTLRGAHNAQNAAAAVAAVTALGLSPAEIAAGLRSFPGLSHRMEEVGRAGRTLFVNDSKATNADAAARALACFEDIFWIAGGKPKTGGIDSLAPYFPRIRKAFLIGEAAAEFAATLQAAEVPLALCGTLERAVTAAAAEAASSAAAQPVVLLSPACASFDQFPNFEVRGDRFRALVGEALARREKESVP